MTKNKKVNIHEVMVVDIMKTADVLERGIGDLLKNHDLTMVQYNILRILRGANPEKLGVGEVKNRMSFPNSDVSRLIDRLVNKDLVNREICEKNRRKMDVCISDNGLQTLSEIDVELKDRFDSFFDQTLSKEEAISLSDKLKRIRENI